MAEEAKKEETTKKNETKKETATKQEAKQVSKPKQQPKKVKPKYVKVIPKVSGKRRIGNRWYKLERDKEIEVSEDAKRCLKKAGAIYL